MKAMSKVDIMQNIKNTKEIINDVFNSIDNSLNSLDEEEILRTQKNLDEELNEQKRVDVRRKYLENKDYEQDIGLRKEFANKIFIFICIWCGFVILVMCFQGSAYSPDKVEWNNNVIITLLTTTFAQVLGLMIIVLKYLFQHK